MAKRSNNTNLSLLQRAESLQWSQLNVDQFNDLLNQIEAQEIDKEIDKEIDSELFAASKKYAIAYVTFQKDLQDTLYKLNNEKEIEEQRNNLLQAVPPDSEAIEAIEKKYQDAVALTNQQIVRITRAKNLGKAVVSAQEEYENVLNSFLGHHMKITYTLPVNYDESSKTYSGGEVYVFEDNNDYSDYMQFSFSKNSKNNNKYYWSNIKYNFNKMMKDLENLRINLIEKYETTKLDNLRRTRLSAERRFDISINYQRVKQSSYKGLILWRSYIEEYHIRRNKYNEWAGIWVMDRANIAEAYAAVIATERVKDFDTNDIRYLLDIFIKDFLLNVDSLGGAINGDVSFGDTEYAIKSVGGGLSGLNQFYSQYALPIIRKEKLYSKKRLLDKYNNNIKNHSSNLNKTKIFKESVRNFSNGNLKNIINDFNKDPLSQILFDLP